MNKKINQNHNHSRIRAISTIAIAVLLFFLTLPSLAAQLATLVDVSNQQMISPLSMVLEDTEVTLSAVQSSEQIFRYSIPSRYQNFRGFHQLTFVAKSNQATQNNTIQIRCAVVESSGEIWRQRFSKPLSSEFNIYGTELSEAYLKLDLTSQKNNRFDADAIKEIQIIYYLNGTIPTASVQIDNLVLYSYAALNLPQRDNLTIADFEALSTLHPNLDTNQWEGTLSKDSATGTERRVQAVSLAISTEEAYQSKRALAVEVNVTTTTAITIADFSDAALSPFDLTCLNRISIMAKSQFITSSEHEDEIWFGFTESSANGKEEWLSQKMTLSSTYAQYSIRLDSDLFFLSPNSPTHNEILDLDQISQIHIYLSAPMTNHPDSKETIAFDTHIIYLDQLETSSAFISHISNDQIQVTGNISAQYDPKYVPQLTWKNQNQSYLMATALATPKLIVAKFPLNTATSSGILEISNFRPSQGPPIGACQLTYCPATPPTAQPPKALGFRITAGDGQDPVIEEIRINNKLFYSGDFINGTTPRLQVLMTDNTGIATLNISLTDADTQTTALYSQSFSTPTASFTATANMDTLSEGQYTLSIIVSDASGRTVTDNHTIEVAESLQISQLLNGPNPFNPNHQATQIQYQLSKDAEVRFYIYSISGKRLFETKVLSGEINGGSTGFNTILWNGQNRWGETVANGVYIGYLMVSDGQDKLVKKLKIAVLK